MERMLVVIFDDEMQAYEGSRALAALDREGSISVHAQAVVKKTADGTVYMPDTRIDFPLRTAGGAAIGGFFGLLGGPVAVGVGAAMGAAVGALADLHRAGVNDDFLTSVFHSLTPGKCAVLADVSEEWVAPVDARMEALGGVVHRTARGRFEVDYQQAPGSGVRDCAGGGWGTAANPGENATRRVDRVRLA